MNGIEGSRSFTREQLKQRLRDKYGGSTINGKIIGDEELDDYLNQQLRNAALPCSTFLGPNPKTKKKQPVSKLIAEVPSYEKAVERERQSALVRPIQTLSNLWPPRPIKNSTVERCLVWN